MFKKVKDKITKLFLDNNFIKIISIFFFLINISSIAFDRLLIKVYYGFIPGYLILLGVDIIFLVLYIYFYSRANRFHL